MLLNLRWLTCCIAVTLCATAPAAELRVAFVNASQLLEQAPQAETARALLQNEFAGRDAQLASEQKRLRILEERLEKEGGSQGEEARSRMQREIMVQQRALKRIRDGFTEDLNLRRNEEFARMQREISQTIAAVAREEGYDLVLESGVVYASERVDITGKVIARLKRDASVNSGSKR